MSVSAPARHLLQPRRLPKLLSIVIPIYNERRSSAVPAQAPHHLRGRLGGAAGPKSCW